MPPIANRERLLERLLVPLDGSPLAEYAIPYVRALARPGTAIHLLEIVREPYGAIGPFSTGNLSPADVRRYDEEAAQDYLETMAQTLRMAGDDLDIRTAVGFGDPAAEILRTADEIGAEMIIMASHGRGTLGRFAFGSVADRVVRTAPGAVLIVRPHDPAPPRGTAQIRRLIVPLDGSSRAAQALPVAATLARRLAIPIQVVSVVDATIAAASALHPETFIAVLSQLRAEVHQIVTEATDQLRRAGLDAAGTILEGPAAAAIADVTRIGDVIVMTSRGRGGVKRWLLGSVAEKLVHEGRVPVLLTRDVDA